MRKYLVKVDDDEFVVQIRLMDEDTNQVEEPKEKVVQPEVKAPKAPAAPGAGEKIEAPLGGTILQINVSAGDQVKTGDIMMTLEALKLENEITAPFDGKVAQVLTTVGASVEAGENLLVIEKA